MASKMYHSFSLLFLATATLLLAVNHVEATRPVGINSFCKTADNKILCTQMVHGAKNWHDAVANALHPALQTATRMQGLLRVVEPTLSGLPVISRKSTIQTCKENFDSAVDDLKRALDTLKTGDKNSLNTYLSAVSITDCTDAFDQFSTPVPADLSKVYNQLNEQVSTCLAVSRQI